MFDGSTSPVHWGDGVDKAQLYDPATGQRSATGNTNVSRVAHAATMLPDGSVLVATGYSDYNAVNNAERYDPATGNWSISSALNGVRDGNTVTLLTNGKVLVAGGTIESPGRTELYEGGFATPQITPSSTSY